MDHLGIRQFAFFGNCIGGPFAMKLMERAPQRVVAAVTEPAGRTRPDSRISRTSRQERLGQGCSGAGLTCRWRPSSSICTTLLGAA